MNKGQFNKHVKSILTKNMKNSNEMEANHVINTFIESVISALKENDEISLVGFGRFYKAKVEARTGRNPKTGKPIEIKAHFQPRFTAGSLLKDACNEKKINKKDAK